MTGWRLTAGRLGAGLLTAALLLLLLEGALRFLPLDRWERDNPAVAHPLFVRGEGVMADFYVTNPHFTGVVKEQRFARVKPPGVKRIFLLGGSAALGWPGPVEGGVSGYLQRALQQAAPGRFEVVNAAAMSYGSHRVLDLLADVARMEPDLIVIWSGNNEYLEQNSLTAFARSAAVAKLAPWLERCALYRGVRLALGRLAPALFSRPSGPDLTDPREKALVRRGMRGRSAATDREVLENYRENLRGMARLIRGSGAAGALCTVPVNLSGWVPVNLTDWDPDRVPEELADPQAARRWLEINDRATAAGEAGRYAEAVAALRELLEMTPRHPLGHYLLGLSLERLGRREEAVAAFSRARDLDPRPIRALSAFAGAVREIAREEGLALVDLEAAFARASVSGAPGLDLFLDYVHPNQDGHRLAAITILERTAGLLDLGLAAGRLRQAVAADAWRATHRDQQAEILYTRGMTLYNNGDLDGAERAYLQVLELAPEFPEPAGNLAVLYEKRGDLDRARRYYEQALRSDPGTLHAANLARLRYRQGDRQGARVLGEQLLRQGVVDVQLYIVLGDLAWDERRHADAAAFYRQALAAGADDPRLAARIAAGSAP